MRKVGRGEGLSLAIYRYAIVWSDGSHENTDIVGTEEMARDMFTRKWLSLHEENDFTTPPEFMELWRAEEPDGPALLRFDFHLDTGGTVDPKKGPFEDPGSDD